MRTRISQYVCWSHILAPFNKTASLVFPPLLLSHLHIHVCLSSRWCVTKQDSHSQRGWLNYRRLQGVIGGHTVWIWALVHLLLPKRFNYHRQDCVAFTFTQKTKRRGQRPTELRRQRRRDCQTSQHGKRPKQPHIPQVHFMQGTQYLYRENEKDSISGSCCRLISRVRIDRVGDWSATGHERRNYRALWHETPNSQSQRRHQNASIKTRLEAKWGKKP